MMKMHFSWLKLVSGLIFLIAIEVSCEKNTAPYGLERATIEIIQTIDSLDHALAGASGAIGNSRLHPDSIRRILTGLHGSVSFAWEADFINAIGILQVVVPDSLSYHEGTDLNSEESIMKVISQRMPSLSNYMSDRTGFPVVADILPVFSGSTSYGAVAVLFDPVGLLDRIIAPLVETPDEIWVMAGDGTTIYEPDLQGIGLNVFRDPYYAGFEDFREACRTIAGQESGQTSYTFYQTGTTTGVLKKVWWNSIHLHDNAWKVIFAREDQGG
jgi:hypothetical protein